MGERTEQTCASCANCSLDGRYCEAYMCSVEANYACDAFKPYNNGNRTD